MHPKATMAMVINLISSPRPWHIFHLPWVLDLQTSMNSSVLSSISRAHLTKRIYKCQLKNVGPGIYSTCAEQGGAKRRVKVSCFMEINMAFEFGPNALGQDREGEDLLTLRYAPHIKSLLTSLVYHLK